MDTLIKYRDKFIAALIYFFTYLNFVTNKKIVFPLTFRGFYSEINNLIFAIIFLKEKKKEIIIDSSRFSYSYKDGITDYLDFDYETVNFDKNKFSNFRDRKLNNELLTRYFFKNYIFKKVRDVNFRKNRINELAILMKKEINNLYKYNLKTKIKIDENINKLNLPSDYVSFHIRRGDKVFGDCKEADLVLIDVYFEKLKKFTSCDKSLNLYVATDDGNILKEIKNKYPQINLFSLYSYENVRESEKKFLNQSRETVRDHTLNLLTEVDILINSKYFIGSFSSNLGRFVGACVGLENCQSVDLSWDSIH
ncbi:hypothetical protein [Ilyobacter sp.]|uniref:hypothetical protein n=1 Tax=Ilyobacter sp. TaxID=3100343 RepID=UPI00356728B7